MNPYSLTFALSLGINLLFFIVAFALKTDKFTDFTYGITFIILALFLNFTNQTYFPIQILITLMIIIWAIRLISYLVIRILRIKKDSRFDDKRENLLSFLQFWVFQGIAVWIIMLPAILILTQSDSIPVSSIMIMGMIVWLMGLLLESIADGQKFKFKSNPKNKDMWIQSGLWKYSRHPNYFGEMLVWWGIYLIVMPTLQGLAWLTIIGPIFITYILMFVSGIPLLEKKYDQKYVENVKYQEYRRKTSLLIPLPPKR